MILDETKRMIKNAIGLEYTNAITPDKTIRRGRYFNSLHEGFAILFEERDEAWTEFQNFDKNEMRDIITYIRENRIDLVYDKIEYMIYSAEYAMAELAQVAGVCKKILDTIDKYYSDDKETHDIRKEVTHGM